MNILHSPNMILCIFGAYNWLYSRLLRHTNEANGKSTVWGGIIGAIELIEIELPPKRWRFISGGESEDGLEIASDETRRRKREENALLWVSCSYF